MGGGRDYRGPIGFVPMNIDDIALNSAPPPQPVALGDLPSRLMGWSMKAKRNGSDRIWLDVETVDRLLAFIHAHQGAGEP